MAAPAFWRAWSIWAVTVAATAAGLIDTLLYPLPPKLAAQTGSPADGAVAIVFIGASATVGALLAWKRPANPIGWLLSGTGLAYAVGVFGVILMHFAGTRTWPTGWAGPGLPVSRWSCISCCSSRPGLCRPAAGGLWPGSPGPPWPAGRWVTRS